MWMILAKIKADRIIGKQIRSTSPIDNGVRSMARVYHRFTSRYDHILLLIFNVINKGDISSNKENVFWHLSILYAFHLLNTMKSTE